MHINVNSRCPIARLGEADFIVQVLADVLAPGEFRSELSSNENSDHFVDGLSAEYVVGRVWAERLDWTYAEECGYKVHAICDAVGATWMQVLETLSRNGGRTFRKELELDCFISDVLFVHELLLHPEIEDRIAVVDAILRSMSTDNSLLMMQHEQSQPYHLEDWEYRDLGFKKIARSNLLLKDNHYRYPFGDSYCAGRRFQFTATLEHENWLLGNWDSLIADHPPQ